MSQQLSAARAAVAIASLVACAPPHAGDEPQALTGATITRFQDGQAPTAGYAGTRDAMLDGGAPSHTHGGDSVLSADGDDAG